MPYQVTQGSMGERLPVAVGTGVWALLFVLGLTLRTELAESGREWWIWTAASGVLLGIVGYTYLLLRRPRPAPGETAPSSGYTGDVDDVPRHSAELTRLRRQASEKNLINQRIRSKPGVGEHHGDEVP